MFTAEEVDNKLIQFNNDWIAEGDKYSYEDLLDYINLLGDSYKKLYIGDKDNAIAKLSEGRATGKVEGKCRL